MASATTARLEEFAADPRLPSAKDEARALLGLVERGASTVQNEAEVRN